LGESEKRFQELVKNFHSKTGIKATSRENQFKLTKVTHFNLKRLECTFYDESFDVSFRGIFILSFIMGIVDGIYGIGAGPYHRPVFFVTFFGPPVYTVAGAALMGTFVT